MSKNTSKTRSEKGRIISAQPPPTQTEDVEDNVDPGCLTKSEFLAMIAHEEGEEIVADILNELMTHVMKKCYEVFLQKQIIPFTVAWAKNTILQMVNWQHLMRDEGDDVDIISILKEDTTPVPLITDSWAEGCVPVIRISNNSQGVQTDLQEAVHQNDPRKNHEAQPINQPKSPIRKPRRNGRSMKLISASHAKIELERKPHPPKTPSPSTLKPPETRNLWQY